MSNYPNISKANKYTLHISLNSRLMASTEIHQEFTSRFTDKNKLLKLILTF